MTNGHVDKDPEVRTYRGRNLEEVLPQIRAELGPDAVVVRQRDGLMGGIGGFFQQQFVEVEARAGSKRFDAYDDAPAYPPSPTTPSAPLEGSADADGDAPEAAPSAPVPTAARRESAAQLLARATGAAANDPRTPAEILREHSATFARQLAAAEERSEPVVTAKAPAAGQEPSGRYAPPVAAPPRTEPTPLPRPAPPAPAPDDDLPPAAESTPAPAAEVKPAPAAARPAARRAPAKKRRATARARAARARAPRASAPSASAARASAPRASASASAATPASSAIPVEPAAAEAAPPASTTVAEDEPVALGAAEVAATTAANEAPPAETVVTATIVDEPAVDAEPVDEADVVEAQLADDVEDAFDPFDDLPAVPAITTPTRPAAAPRTRPPAPRRTIFGRRRAVAIPLAQITGSAAGAEVTDTLAERGIAPGVARDVIVDAAAHVLPFAAHGDLRAASRTALARRIPTPEPPRLGGRAVAFVGAGGTGKTRCVAGLATAYAGGSTVPVVVISLAPADGGAELTALLKEHGIKVEAFATAQAAAKRIAAARAESLVVIDTPAVDPGDAAGIDALAAGLAPLALDETQLVVPATLSAAVAQEQLEWLAPLQPTGIAMTHADATEHIGAVVELACATRLPLAYVNSGLALPGALAPADPMQLAERLLP